jgi:hypothetical protein
MPNGVPLRAQFPHASERCTLIDQPRALAARQRRVRQQRDEYTKRKPSLRLQSSAKPRPGRRTGERPAIGNAVRGRRPRRAYPFGHRVLGAQIAGALDALHTAGISHGDITPRGVRIAVDGTIRLTPISLGYAARKAPASPRAWCSLG